MATKYLIKNGRLYSVRRVIQETKRTLVLDVCAYGVLVVRKNGKDAELFSCRPFGWARDPIRAKYEREEV